MSECNRLNRSEHRDEPVFMLMVGFEMLVVKDSSVKTD
jgi:hypothetical protein